LPLLLLSHLGNSLSAVLGAWLVRRFVAERPTLISFRELLGVVTLAGLVGLLPTALIGAKLNVISNVDSSYWNSFVTWYTSDLLGVILVTPTLLVWHGRIAWPSAWKFTPRTFEFGALMALLIIATGSAFYFGWLRQTETLYVAFPFTIWAAVRFRLRGTTVAILVTALVAQCFTALGYGALGSSSLTEFQKSIEIMVSVGVFAVIGLLPATVFAALKAAQAGDAIRTRTMTLIATGAKLPTILESIVRGVEAENPEMRGSILLVDSTGTRLQLASAPNLPDFFNQAIDGLAIGPDSLACGSAAHANQRVIIKDIDRDPRTANHRELARRANVQACWSQPFSDSSGRILGTFAVYYNQSQNPGGADIALITAASHLAAIATERKQLEEQFLRAQRLEGIGTLAGGIAHDLNNVLTPIVVGAELLREANLDMEERRILDNIAASGRRGANLVRQVLTFARGVEGKRETLHLETIVADLETMAANTFPKNIVVTREFAPSLPLISGDRTQIEQVLFNLCVNARDAMPSGGRLMITGRARTVDHQLAHRHPGVVPGNFVELEVADTGSGINADILHRIFEPFYTTKKLGQGTGLGLSTALGIVRSHGGFLEVSSVPGEGSAFRVCLPAKSGEAATRAVAPKSDTLPRGKGELILLVDDEPAIRQTSTRLLIGLGYAVVSAENGAEALKQVKQHGDEIALVVTDLMMPVMDGHKLAEALQQLKPDLQLITVSGFDAATKTPFEGSRHHLPKPYTMEALANIIADVLNRTRL
jgi:signal transduction histidine kinase/integral membrane sensor domain MASE1